MNVDLTPFFLEYEAFVSQVDNLFERVAKTYTAEVACRSGCSDCCHALFDISLVESLYLNSKFLNLDLSLRNNILIEADKADRKAFLFKKKTCRETNSENHADILMRTAKERVRCPLLAQNDTCSLYQFRPITCRTYGIPLEIGGKSHTCGLSRFEPGKIYPTVKLERIHDFLFDLSTRIVSALGTPYEELRAMYVPVSTALMTVYSEDFFGLGKHEGGPSDPKEEEYA